MTDSNKPLDELCADILERDNLDPQLERVVRGVKRDVEAGEID